MASLRFAEPISHVYNPIDYAWAPYERYLNAYASGAKSVVFLGMNPGPFGMVQTGVPFGEVSAVRDWLRITGPVTLPQGGHPKRPVEGFDCKRSEVSGRRLWGLFAARFETPDRFFEDHFVLNYCPLAFVEASGKNRTPDKLPAKEKDALFACCDRFLKVAVNLLEPAWIVGVGDFAFNRTQELFGSDGPRLGRILHPSPASPAANRDWAGAATAQLVAQGIWAATQPVR